MFQTLKIEKINRVTIEGCIRHCAVLEHKK